MAVDLISLASRSFTGSPIVPILSAEVKCRTRRAQCAVQASPTPISLVFIRSAKGIQIFGVLCRVYANPFDGWVGVSLSHHPEAGAAKDFPNKEPIFSPERGGKFGLGVNIMSGAMVTLPIILEVKPIIKLI
jgi:hypothetical protein